MFETVPAFIFLFARFVAVGCAIRDVGGAKIVLTDPSSQGALTALVSNLELSMAKAGIPVHRYRMEEAPFHASP